MQRLGRNHVNLFIRVYVSLRDENRGKAAFSRFVRLSHWSFLLWGLSRVSQHGARTWQQVRTLKSAAVPWDSLKLELIHEYNDLITAQLEGRDCDTTPYILYAYIKPRVCTWIREKLNEKKLTNLWDSSALGGWAGVCSLFWDVHISLDSRSWTKWLFVKKEWKDFVLKAVSLSLRWWCRHLHIIRGHEGWSTQRVSSASGTVTANKNSPAAAESESCVCVGSTRSVVDLRSEGRKMRRSLNLKVSSNVWVQQRLDLFVTDTQTVFNRDV